MAGVLTIKKMVIKPYMVSKMSRFFAIAILSVFSVNASIHGAGPVALPEDGKVSVIELWYIDPGQTPKQPEVFVLADGSVWTRSGQTDTLTQEKLQALVATLLQKDLHGCTSQSLHAEIVAASQREQLSHHIPQAGDTVIRVRTGTQFHEIRCHAAGLLVNRFPGAQLLQGFYSAQQRLENLRAVTHLGGDAVANRLAGVAQEKLAAEYGIRVPVSSENLSVARSLPDGTRYCQFLVDSRRSERPMVVSLFQSPGQPSRVTLMEQTAVIQ